MASQPLIHVHSPFFFFGRVHGPFKFTHRIVKERYEGPLSGPFLLQIPGQVEDDLF